MIFGKFMIRKTDILMEDGRPVAIGGLQHQTWSATGLLRMVWYGLVGMRFEDEITFRTIFT